MKVLLVSCNTHTAISIHLALQLRWLELEILQAETRRNGLRALKELSPELVFIMVDPLPSDLDTLEFLQEARLFSDAVLIALSREPSDAELTLYLGAGADDYLALPVNGPVLLAHIIAVLRRAGWPLEMGKVSLAGGRLMLDPLSYRACLGEYPLHLTPTEFKLLYCLAKERGHVVPRAALQDAIGGGEDPGSLARLRQYVYRLRQKLNGALGDAVQILSVPGVGYQLIDGTD